MKESGRTKHLGTNYGRIDGRRYGLIISRKSEDNKPGKGKEVNEGTVTTISLETTSTLKKSNSTFTNSLEEEKVPNVVQMKREHKHNAFKEFASDIGVTTSQIQFMTGYQIRKGQQRGRWMKHTSIH